PHSHIEIIHLGKLRRSITSLPVFNPERLRIAKAQVDKAVKMHKVFSVHGPYPVIREALRARGWVEQFKPRSKRHAHKHHSDVSRTNSFHSNDAGESDDSDDPDGLYDIMSRLVRHEMVYFYWTNRRDAINTNNLYKEQITNHFAKAGSFTTKVGLCVNLGKLHWFDSADPDTFFPRCYRPAAQGEKHAFIEDYRRTACVSLLKYIVEREQGDKTSGIIHTKKRQKRRYKSVVLPKVIDFALKVCQEFLESLEHNDIDIGLESPHTLTEEQWTDFIESYYLIVHRGIETENCNHLVNCCKNMLQKLREVSPQLDIDGIHNIWIIKPGAKSRGRGIKCAKRLHDILRLTDGDPTLIRDSKWVVQKYLERPLLVHDTKFDVRQWFLVTDWNPLTVWFYKKCYLRFSTQLYSLDTLDSSVHLCNNSIQKHLMPSQQRHRGIPADNMWSDEQFKTFLSSQGQEAQWESVVICGMKKAVIHALQTAQDLVESRKNTFELYGADFMLGHDLRPWLIEINASPTMAPSTPVTARLCAAVQEDTLRVVLDRRTDRTANTGDFELIYRQAAVKVPQYLGIKLLVEGFEIKSSCPLPPLRSAKHSASKRCGPDKNKESAAEKAPPLPKTSFKGTVNHLKNADSAVVLRPPVPCATPVSTLSETLTLNLPLTVTKSIYLPISAHSLFSRRTSGLSKAYADRFKPCNMQKYPHLALEMTVPK
uniref:Tubulin tyrosine ligase-like family, member 3 n=1 Tax=Sphaeramia orbicularis TaxID=375764 RepID=A0A673BAX8_9TELE